MNLQRGMTLIEILVTLAIAAVLMGMAAPSFSQFIEQRTLTTDVNGFVLAATLARSEAVRRGTSVSVQALDASDNSNEWGPGWCVTVGNPGNCAGAIRRFPPLNGSTFDAGGNLDTVGALTYSSRGLLIGGAGGANTALVLCGADAGARGRQARVNAIGRVNVGEITCP